MSARPISAAFLDRYEDTVSRASVTRSEALEFVDRFWAAVQQFPAGRSEIDEEVNLSFARDEEKDFIEFSAWAFERFDARYRYVDVLKLFWLIPTREVRDLHLLLTSREEAAELVETYFRVSDPMELSRQLLRRGASKHRCDF